MGKKKIKYILIQDDKIRNITFNKRKAGLLKKAAEITMLTSIKLRLTFTDLSGNLINFSSPSFEQTQDFSRPSLYKNVYNFTLKDYPGFKKMKKAEMDAQKKSQAEKLLKEANQPKNIILNVSSNNTSKIQKQQPVEKKQIEQIIKKVQHNQNITIIKEEPQVFQLPRFNLQNKQQENEINDSQKKKKGLKIDLKINIPTDRKDLQYQMDYIKYTHSRASDISQLDFVSNYSAINNKTGMISRQSNYQQQTRPTPIIDKKIMQYQQQQQKLQLEEENQKDPQQQNYEDNSKYQETNDYNEKKQDSDLPNKEQNQQDKKKQEFMKQQISYQQADFKQPLPSPRGAFKLHSATQQKNYYYQQKQSPITGGGQKQNYSLLSPNKQPQNINFFNQLNSNQSPSQFLNNNSNQQLLNCPLSSNPFQQQLFPLIVNNNYQINQNVLSMSPKSASPFLQNSLDQDSLAQQYQQMQKAYAYQAPLSSREFSLRNSCASFGDKQNQTQFSFTENVKNNENNSEIQIKKENEENYK